ncbi:hypothetical protein BC831DRAFT_483374, partial [Entophlyctis helioformis]
MTVEIRNPNRYELNLNSVVMSAASLVAKSQDVNGVRITNAAPALRLNGDVQRPLFPNPAVKLGYTSTAGFDAVTTRVMYFSFDYYTDPKPLTDPGVAQLMVGCGVAPGLPASTERRVMTIAYTATMDAGWLDTFGFRPVAKG